MEIRTIKSYKYEIFSVEKEGKTFHVSRTEDFLDGGICYEVVDISKLFFGRVSPDEPLFREIINAVEFRKKA